MSLRGNHQLLLSYGGFRSISDGIWIGGATELPTTINFTIDGADNGFFYTNAGGSEIARVVIPDRTGTWEEEYSRGTWTFNFHAASARNGNHHPTGARLSYHNFGGLLGMLDTIGDGSYEEYSSAPANFPSYSQIWTSATAGYGCGDSTATDRFYKFTLATSPDVVNETLLATSTTHWFYKNGTGVTNKIYSVKVNATNYDIGYIDTTDDSWNALVTGLTTTINVGSYGPLLMGSDNYLYNTDNSGTAPYKVVQRSNSDGSVVDSITLPSYDTGSLLGLWEAPDGKIWVRAIRMHAFDPSTMEWVVHSVPVSAYANCGITSGGLLVFYEKVGSDHYYRVMVT